MFNIEEILYCLWREKSQPKAARKAIFLHFHRYNNSVINFPTTGLAHSSKSGSRNWSWLAGAPGETNSVIVLDIFSPLVSRLWRSNSLIPWENSLREPNSQRSPSKSIFDQQVWPAGVDCGVAYDCRARKTRRPGFDQNIPEVAALLCANFCKKSPIWIAISFVLLACYSTGCEVYSWTFHLICMHYALARVCANCAQLFTIFRRIEPRVSEPSQNPQLDKLALERGRWEDDRSSAGFHVFHSSGSLPSVCRQLECIVVQKN